MRNRRGPRFRICYPGYRYCGPGCSGPGRPTNPVDACCKMHDECYSIYGRSRYCDEIFEHCLRQYMNPYNKMGRDARLFSRAMKVWNFLF